MITSHRGYCRFVFLLICLFSASAFAGVCPDTDLTEDCRVDLDDVDAFFEQWLNPELCDEGGICADFNSPEGIDFIDFSTLADDWQTHGTTLFINEFMASNNSDSDINDPFGDFDDWIEIYNFSDTPIDLAGFYLTDDLTNPTKWQIPAGYPSETTVPANGFILFWADEEPEEGPLHTTYKLSSSGEDIALFDTDGTTLIDSFAYPAQTTNVAYGRYPDGENVWRYFPTPTPLANNDGAYLGEVEEVEFSHKRGFYSSSSPFELTMATVTPDSIIYYTTDGRSPIEGESPTATALEYTTPITISGTSYIRAGAIKGGGWMPAKVETHTYIFDANSFHKSIPVIAVVGDPNESLWAPNGVMANPYGRGILWERPVSLEVLDRNNLGNDYQIDSGIRVHGNFRDYNMVGDDWMTCWINWWPYLNEHKYSFRFYFRDEYGQDRFDFPFFPYEPEGEKKQCIVLRGGKNDACTPFAKDEWSRRLFRKMGGIQVTGSFVNLFINGVYKAYYNPCNRDNRQFFQEWYGTDNEFDVIVQFDGVRDGDSTAWSDFLNYIDTHDLSIQENYEYVDSQLDLVQFIDFLIVEIHTGNFDWPNNNWTVHREKIPGTKFRFSIWDAEGIEQWYFGANCEKCADTAFDKFPSYDPQGLNNGPWSICRIYRKLKANPNFVQLFKDRIHKHYKNNGIMMMNNLLTSWNQTVDEVRPVLPWIDSSAPAFIRDVFLPRREPYVMTAFQNNGLHNISFGGPVFNVNAAYKYGGYVSTSDTFTLTDPCASGGTIYYTTDGSDPRMPATGATQPSQILFVADNAAKKVLIPGSDIGTTWRGGSEPYNETGWTSGTGGVGFDAGTGYEPFIGIDVQTAMYNLRNGCYIRIPFNVDAGDLADITTLTLRTRYDDGFVAYINGTEVQRANFTGTPLWNSATSSSSAEATSAWNSYNISSYINLLHTGTNILAIHGLNRRTTDNDFLISSELEGAGEIEPNLSPGAIQYAGGFTINKSANLRSRIFKNTTGEWSPLNEAVYGLTNVASNLRITELMYNLADTGEPNDEDTEYVELKNVGGSAINLNLVSFDKGITFTFGPNSLAAGQYILVVKDINAFTTKYLAGRPIAGQYIGSLNNGGERIRLLDAVGTTIQDFNYKDGWREIADGDGYSLTIINPADSNVNNWNYNDSWRASADINGSPGWDDSGIIPNPGAIAINEIMAHSHDVAPDWIELRNTTGSPVNIGGWYLSDSDTDLMMYRFAAGTTIPANGFIVVREDVNFGDEASDPGKLIPFALSENGDFVRLTSALDANSFLTGYREKEDFGASETGVSFGRYYKASTDSYNFVPMDSNTPGSANAYPKVGPIVITEIFYHPDWPAGGNFANDEYEFIELRNISGSPVTLFDFTENEAWKFTDGIDYTFPAAPDEVIIPAGGRILVVRNAVAFSWRYPSVPTDIIKGFEPNDTGWLANEGEQLELGKPGDVELGERQYIRIDRINYSDGSHPGNDPNDPWPIDADGLGKSLKRTNNSLYGNDPNNWTAATPTPES